MDAFWQDLRLGVRMLRARPISTLVAGLTLAIGIGATTSIFSAVSALLLRPLPIADAGRVAFGIALRDGFDPFGSSPLELLALQDRARAFSSVGAARRRPLTLMVGTEPVRANAVDVTAGYFRTLGVEPALGRPFTPEDDRPEAPAAAILSYDLWRRAFGGRADAVGQAITTDAGVWTVVGVMGRGFDLPGRAEIWMPARLSMASLPIDRRAQRGWDVVARLRPGVSMSAANAEARAIANALEREWPQLRRGWSYTMVPIRQELLGDIDGRTERALLVLMTAVGCVLCICCANVACLLLVRGISREREIALRAALGAGRARIVRQLLTENALLAAAGGAAGLLIAEWTTPLVARLNPLRPDALGAFLVDFRIDGRVLAFASAVTIVTAFLFGLVPALHALGRRTDLAATLKRTDVRGGGPSRRWMSPLVIGEVALATALIVSASLIVQSFARLRSIDLGFRSDHLLTAEIALPTSSYPEHQQRVQFVQRVLDRLRAVPGVVSAGTSTNLPLDPLSYDAVFTAEGRVRASESDVPITAHRLVSPGYLETLGVRLVAGRLLDERDRAGAPRVVVVTEEFARQAWPGQDPIGRRVRRGSADDAGNPWLTVVGVVANVKEDSFNFRIDRPAWYIPYAQVDSTVPLTIAVRTAANPTSAAGALRDAVHRVDPKQALARVRPLDEQIADVTVTDRFSAALVGALAIAGMFLAACGLYGVVAYSVGQRARELSVRIALGARPVDVIGLVVGEGALLIAGGVAAGLAAARASTSLLANLLYEVRPGDALTFAAAALVLAATGLAACYVPARRASRLSPTVALKSE